MPGKGGITHRVAYAYAYAYAVAIRLNRSRACYAALGGDAMNLLRWLTVATVCGLLFLLFFVSLTPSVEASNARGVARGVTRGVAPPVVHVAGYDAVTIVSLLNLRQAPSLQARVLLRLSYGARLRVHGYTAHWLSVTTQSGLTGFVFGRDVHTLPIVQTAQPQQAKFVPPFLIVQVAAANLRTAPSLAAPVRLVLAARTLVALRAERGNWASVVTRSGIAGWIWRPLTRPVA